MGAPSCADWGSQWSFTKLRSVCACAFVRALLSLERLRAVQGNSMTRLATHLSVPLQTAIGHKQGAAGTERASGSVGEPRARARSRRRPPVGRADKGDVYRSLLSRLGTAIAWLTLECPMRTTSATTPCVLPPQQHPLDPAQPWAREIRTNVLTKSIQKVAVRAGGQSQRRARARKGMLGGRKGGFRQQPTAAARQRKEKDGGASASGASDE